MTITLHYNYTLDSNNQTYLGERDFLLKVAENNGLRLYGLGQGTDSSGLTVYKDSTGNPSIGYGYDLYENAANAYADLSNAGATINTDAAGLSKAINDYKTGAITLAQLQSLISLPNETAATTLLDTVATTKQTELNKFLSDHGIDWLSSAGGSQEYAVLLSMWYQSPGGDRIHNGYFMDKAGNISRMTQALIDGNRAEVWYQIRYGSSAGGNGVVVRRYAESQVFGLYNDPNNVPPADALQVYQMYTQHSDTILGYEAAYGTNPYGASPDVPANQIAVANQNYGLTGSNAIGTLAQELNPAAIELDGIYNFNFNPLNIFATSSTDLTINSTDTTADLLIGVGGSGNETLIGGSGNDTYVFISPTNGTYTTETINDIRGGGQGSIYVDSQLLTSDASSTLFANVNTNADGSKSYIWQGNGTTYSFTPVASGGNFAGYTGTLTITGGPLGTAGNQIVINNFNLTQAQSSSGYLGIHLSPIVGLAPGISLSSFYSTANLSSDVASGNIFQFTVGNSAGGQVTLSGGNASSYICSGANLIQFDANGNATITIPAGQDSVALTLVDTSSSTTADNFNLTATITDSSGTVTSNNLAITFDSPNPNVAGTAANTINGDLTPTQFTDSNGNIYYKTDANGNLITDGTSDPGFNDVLYGDGKNDVINTGGGNNIVNGMGGSDTINGGAGNDVILGGDMNGGNYVPGNVSYTGTQIGAGPDTNGYPNNGGNGNNLINGGGGQDVIIVGNGSNQIYAGTQTDLATALSNQKSATASGQKGDLIAVGDGNNTIVGGNGNDLIFTGTGSNTIVMGPGADTLVGGVEVNEASTLWSVTATNYVDVVGVSAPFTPSGAYNGSTFNGPVGLGNDTIFGGSGNSTYLLSNGNNWLDAGGGNDYIQAGVGSNTIYGGTGNDTIYGGGGSNYIDLESGSDSVVLSGGNNTVIGGTGNNIIFSGDTGVSTTSETTETNSANYIEGGSGNDTIIGSGGNDTLISGSESGGGSTLIEAGAGNAYIVGGNSNDTIYAGAGNDTIYAGGGDTYINLNVYENETNTVYGGAGSDTILGGGGNDVIYAGDGGTAAAPTYVYSGNGTTSIYGGGGVDYLAGGTGTDLLVAGTGTSTLQGGSGTETMYSSIGNATLIAGSGSDTLYGGSGVDVLQGSTGNTLYVAGSGNETIQGGTGNNTYEFDAGFGNVELQNTQAGDTLYFGTGISVADLTVSVTTGSDGNSALLIQTSSGGQLTLDGGLNGAISAFGFEDSGQILSVDDLLTQSSTVQSTVVDASGNSTVIGGGGGSTLIGGTGSNTFYAQGSDNTIVVSNSSDVINAQAGSADNTVVAGVSYVLPDNVQNLTLNGTAGITGTGNSADNVITANSGNDTLIGGGGNDTLIGGSGQDTFNLGYGTGNDTVIDSSAQGGVIQLNTGVSISGLSAVQQGNDLLLQVDANDSLLIKDYYSSPQTSWVIQDGAGNTATPQNVVDTTLQVPQSEISFIQSKYQGIMDSYLAQGYTTLSDGTLFEQTYQLPDNNGLSATVYQDTTTTTESIALFGSNSVSTSSYTTLNSSQWVPNFSNYIEVVSSYVHNVSVSETTINSAASVINADPSFQQTLSNTGVRGFDVTWQVTPSMTLSTSTTSSMGYVYDGTGSVNGLTTTSDTTTVSEYAAYGIVGGPVYDAASIPASGTRFPSAVSGLETQVQDVNEIQTINLTGNGQTVYANDLTVVNALVGNDLIYNAGYANGGTGNDTMIGGGIMVAGTGNDQIFSGAGSSTIQIDPNVVSSDLIGGAGNSDRSQFLDNVYQSMGISDWQGSYQYATLYQAQGEAGNSFYPNAQRALAALNGMGFGVASTQDAISSGLLVYYPPLPVLFNALDQFGLQPSPYYAANNVPVVLAYANNFQGLAPYYAQGLLPAHTISFGAGVSASDLKLSWGQTMGSISGLATDPQSEYTTLNISWGANGQSIQVMIPHFNDPLGSGVSGFTFADGTTLSMAQMVAMAPPAPSFDPGLFVFQQGMGTQTVGSNYSNIMFGAGITPDMITLGLGSLMLRVGTTGDVIHITNFDPTNALAPNSIQDFYFADGTVLTYDQMLAKGFDIYGTTGDQTLSGTNLVNRIYAGSGNDTLIGTGTSDLLVAGSGVDTLIGGTGNETFVINNAADVIDVNASAASNTIESSISYVLPSNVQNLTLIGNANLTATGNDLNDVITANAGSDTLIGGTGNDIFVLNQNGGHQTIVDGLKGSGDVIQFGAGITAGNTQFFQQGADLLVNYGTQGNSALIQNFAPNGVTGSQVIAQFRFADGSSGTYTNDGQGNAGMKAYDGNGNLVGDFWQTSDGSYGNDTYNADGSSSSSDYSPDGSYYTYTQDASGGNYFERDYSTSGALASDYWSNADGSWGTDTYNADGSSSGTAYNADNSYSNYTNDGQGNVTTTNYSASSVKLSDSWTKSGGSYGSDNFNADGTSSGSAYNADGSYSSYTNDGHGDMTTNYFDAGGTLQSYSMLAGDGQGNGTLINYNASGIELGYVVTSNDGAGDTSTGNYDANGNQLSDSYQSSDGSTYSDTYTYDAKGNQTDTWQSSDGSHGVDIYNVDGSGSGTDYNADGSYDTYTQDANGNYFALDYASDGTKVGDNWMKADGSHGSDTFNADGSTSGTAYNRDGSYTSYTNDGHGNVTTVSYNTSGVETGYSTLTSDGSGNSTTTNYDASGNELGYDTVVSDGQGGITTKYYDAGGNLQNYSVLSSDGQGNGTLTNYDASSAELGYSVLANDGAGDSTTTNFDVNGVKLSDNWIKAGGSSGNDIFNADGSSAGTVYYRTGSYSSYTNDGLGDVTTKYFGASGNLQDSFSVSNDGQGDVTTKYFDANGNLQSYNVLVGDGHGNGTQTNFDANGVELGYSVLTDDGLGDTTETDFDVNGIKIGDTWTTADGTSGYDNFNADGSSSGGTFNADGSYSNYTNDGHGNVTTKYLDINDNLKTYTVLASDGHGNGTLTDYNANGIEIGYSVLTNDGLGDTSTNNYDANGILLSDAYQNSDGSSLSDTYTYDSYGNQTDTWQKGDGSHGIDIYNVDGSSSGTDYNADGSYYTYTQDASGTYFERDYSTGGNLVGDYWSKADGSYGDDTFNADGSSSGETYNADNSYSNYTNDGLGNVTTTTFNASGVKLSDSWAKSDGSYGSDTFNADGSSSGMIHNSNGGYSSYTNDGLGDVTTKYFDATGNLQSYTVLVSDGQGNGTLLNFNSNGIELGYSLLTNDRLGDTTTKNYDANNTLLSDSWQYSDGSHGSGTYNADGSSSSASYNADGSYSVSTSDGQGNSTTMNYAANGNLVDTIVSTNDGAGDFTTTVTDPNGSYQQSTVKSDGSTTTKTYDAVTGEVTGSVATAGAAYSYTYDDTINVGGVAGVTEAKQTNTYADGSTYSTDTVTDPNGSYQQSTVKSDGSTTTKTYDAVTGEVTGSVATAGAAYSYTYDDTINVGGVAGVTEAKQTNTYTDGSTYSTDTVYSPDGSHFQAWSKSDGTAGSVAVNASGSVIGDSSVHADGSQEVDASGNSLFIGNQGADSLAGGSGNDMLIGGAGSDAISTGSGNNLIAFNLGDGQDVVNASAGQSNVLSLGGNFAYSDLTLQKNGNDLVLDVGTSDSVTFQNWYAGSSNIVDLQVIASAMSDFSPGSSDVLRNSNVESFDFQNLVAQFNQAMAADPTLTSWGVMNGLLSAHLSGSDTAALGGDLAYEYGARGNLTGFNVSAAENTLANAQFGTAPQTLSAWSTLNTGTAQIK